MKRWVCFLVLIQMLWLLPGAGQAAPAIKNQDHIILSLKPDVYFHPEFINDKYICAFKSDTTKLTDDVQVYDSKTYNLINSYQKNTKDYSDRYRLSSQFFAIEKNNSGDYKTIMNIATGRVTELDSSWKIERAINNYRGATRPCSSDYLTSIAFYKDHSLCLMDENDMRTISITDSVYNPKFADWFPSGKGFFYLAQEQLKAYNLDGTTTVIGPVKSLDDASTLNYNPSGSKALIHLVDGSIRIYDMNTKAVSIINSSPAFGPWADCIWSEDGSKLIMVRQDGHAYVLQENGQWIMVGDIPDDIIGVKAYYHNKLFIQTHPMSTQTYPGNIYIFDLKTNQFKKTITGITVAVTPDQKRIAIARDTDQWHWFDETNNKLGSKIVSLYQWPWCYGLPTRSNVFIRPSGDRQQVYSVDPNTCRIKTLMWLKRKDKVTCFNGIKTAVLYSTSTRNRIYIYNGHKMRTVLLPGTPNYDISLSPNEKHFYCTCEQKGKLYGYIGKI